MTTSPSTQNLTLGRGKVSIAEFSGTTHGAYARVGNCTDFNATITEEKLEHEDSQSAAKAKDKSVTLKVGYDVDFVLDEISRANLAKFFKGTLTGPRIQGLTDISKEYAIKFESDNAAGPNYTYEFHKVTLSPGAAFALLSDDWSKLSFKAAGESDTVNHPESPYFDIVEMTTTTT